MNRLNRRYSTKKLDLTGQRYGKLTVLAPASNQGRNTAWYCRCDCGSELEVRTDHLRAGHITSCGCVGIVDRITLVDGTCVEMLEKNTVRSNNRSGVPGVDWVKSRGKWRASICFKQKRYHLGYYDDFRDAVDARQKAEREMIAPFLASIRGERDWHEAIPAGRAERVLHP